MKKDKEQRSISPHGLGCSQSSVWVPGGTVREGYGGEHSKDQAKAAFYDGSLRSHMALFLPH